MKQKPQCDAMKRDGVRRNTTRHGASLITATCFSIFIIFFGDYGEWKDRASFASIGESQAGRNDRAVALSLLTLSSFSVLDWRINYLCSSSDGSSSSSSSNSS